MTVCFQIAFLVQPTVQNVFTAKKWPKKAWIIVLVRIHRQIVNHFLLINYLTNHLNIISPVLRYILGYVQYSCLFILSSICSYRFAESLRKPTMWQQATAVCEKETMCFHNLSKPVAVHKTRESIYFSPICTWPSSKKHVNPLQSESLLCSVSKICNSYIDYWRQTTSGMRRVERSMGSEGWWSETTSFFQTNYITDTLWCSDRTSQTWNAFQAGCLLSKCIMM